MQLQHLRYFVALARERHFANAAGACKVSQPTLSAGLAALEHELGRRLVERDRRFIGLTPQGEAVLPWAEQVLGSVRGLAQAADVAGEALTGEFRLAAIPAALPSVGAFAEALLRHNPGLGLSVQTGTSREIEHGLLANSFDAGLTYLDHEPPANMLSVPLHAENYVFAARADGPFASRIRMSWAEAAGQRLCLLHQGMQYRRLLDAQFAARGLSVTPAVIADSHLTLLALVRSGAFVSIVPDAYARMLAGLDWCQFLPFDDPAERRRIGLVVVNRDPLGSMTRAALATARTIEGSAGLQ